MSDAESSGSPSRPDSLSMAVVRNVVLHIAAEALLPETPPAATALLADELAPTLADLVAPDGGQDPDR